jgi:type II secretory pathway component GspD/PulD (secretin)
LFARPADRSSPIISGNVNPSLKTPITLSAREASLSEVLRVLADRSGMNFVVGEGVTREKISIILNNTPLDEAINLLVRASGLSYEIIGNSILIAEPDKLKEDVGLSSYVVELKYARAEEVAVALGDLSKNVRVDKGGNRLICYASPRVIMEIERIVMALDKPHILVLLETRIIEVKVDKLNQLGIKYDEITPHSVIGVPAAPIKDGFKYSSVTRGEVLGLNAVLDMMVQNKDARILMDSKLTTTNNREASLHIGEVIPYVIQTYNAGGEAPQIQKENVGMMLKMTPHINDKNEITLTLSPEVSNILYWENVVGGRVPVTRVRKTNTTVRVESGQTVILAGLLHEETKVTVSKLPILGDIPVLGLLFRNKRDQVEKTNLVVEVIPRIIHDPAEISKYMTVQREAPKKGGRKAKSDKRRSENSGTHTEIQPAAASIQSESVEPAAAQPVPVAVPAQTAQPEESEN